MNSKYPSTPLKCFSFSSEWKQRGLDWENAIYGIALLAVTRSVQKKKLLLITIKMNWR